MWSDFNRWQDVTSAVSEQMMEVEEGLVGATRFFEPTNIEKFKVTDEQASFDELRGALNGSRRRVYAGEYIRMTQGSSVVMSNTPDELQDMMPLAAHARDHVLINGLGLGGTVFMCLMFKSVERITVIEINANLIDRVGPLFDDRVEIIHDDALTYTPPKGVRYGAVWHDIWSDISTDNLQEITKLKRKYGRRTDWQQAWLEPELRHLNRTDRWR